jgi:DnaK suppressor protein
MTLLRDYIETVESGLLKPARQNGYQGKANLRQHTPVGGPTDEHARNALNTLRSRLDAQLQSGDEYESGETRAILAEARYRLAQVKDALARMDEGRYGQCVDCATQINADRLVIQPFATRCTGCQDRHDRTVRRAPVQG